MVKRSGLKPANPWRKLECGDYVIAAAVKGTARCAACQSKINKGQIQLGVFYTHHDKFTVVRWYHRRCVIAPKCLLKKPMELCGVEDLRGEDLDGVLRWLGFGQFKKRE